MPDYELAKRPGFPNWYIVWSDARRSKRYSTGTPDRKQAELVLAAHRLEVARKPEAKPEEIGIAAVLQEYKQNHGDHIASAERASIAINHLTDHWGLSTVDALTIQSQDEYIVQRR